jgi:hypothetical protein
VCYLVGFRFGAREVAFDGSAPLLLADSFPEVIDAALRGRTQIPDWRLPMVYADGATKLTAMGRVPSGSTPMTNQDVEVDIDFASLRRSHCTPSTKVDSVQFE